MPKLMKQIIKELYRFFKIALEIEIECLFLQLLIDKKVLLQFSMRKVKVLIFSFQLFEASILSFSIIDVKRCSDWPECC